MNKHEPDQLYQLLGQALYYNDSTREFFRCLIVESLKMLQKE